MQRGGVQRAAWVHAERGWKGCVCVEGCVEGWGCARAGAVRVHGHKWVRGARTRVQGAVHKRVCV